MLKPVEEDELIGAVKKSIADIEEERAEITSNRRALSAVREQLPLLRSELLNELIRGRKMPDVDLAEKLTAYEIPFGIRDPFVILLIRLETVRFGSDFNSLMLFEFAVCNIADEVFFDFPVWRGKDSHGHLVFVLKCGGDSELDRIAHAAKQLLTFVRQNLRGTVSLMLGKPGKFPSDFPHRYVTELVAFRRYISNDQELSLQFTDTRHPALVRALRSLNEPLLLHDLFESDRWDEIRLKLEQAFEELSDIQPELLHESLLELYIASGLIETAHKHRLPFGDRFGAGPDGWMDGGSIRSLSHFREWTFELVEALRTKTIQPKTDSRALLVKQVQAYVEAHLDRDVSLQAIADHVFLNPTYLSSVYKHQTGVSLSDYVYKLRMDKAAYYLLHTTDRVYEISFKLGLQNTNYFIKLFKKHFNVTPLEYREKWKSASSAGVL